MGTFFHPITLIGPSGASETLEALVDTGSTFTTIPRPLLERLGVEPFARARLRLATGEAVERDLGEVRAELDGEAPRTIICVFGDPYEQSRIGRHTLDCFLLEADEKRNELVRKKLRLITHV